jgi:hypothetical protein
MEAAPGRWEIAPAETPLEAPTEYRDVEPDRDAGHVAWFTQVVDYRDGTGGSFSSPGLL